MPSSFLELLHDIRELEELDAQRLHLTAYENCLSKTASSFLSSDLAGRYYFSSGNADDEFIDYWVFTATGLPAVAKFVQAAESALCKMLGAAVVTMRPLSGLHAMVSTLALCSQPGQTVMTIDHNDGGHFITPSALARMGRNVTCAVFDPTTQTLDVEKTAKRVVEEDCSVIYLDISTHISPVDIRSLRELVGDDRVIIYDASHTAGLMLGGVWDSPLDNGADVVCGSTHKTIPGPQKGFVAFRDEDYGIRTIQGIASSMVSNSHTHHLLALSTTILEMFEFGSDYATAVVANARALASALTREGLELGVAHQQASNHQVHLALKNQEVGSSAATQLLQNLISVNFERRFGDTGFLRLGVQEVTRRGMTEQEMSVIAELVVDALSGKNVRDEVSALRRQFSDVHFSFDSQLRGPVNESDGPVGATN